MRGSQRDAVLPPPADAADVGTGSGCIAVTMAVEKLHAAVAATELLLAPSSTNISPRRAASSAGVAALPAP